VAVAVALLGLAGCGQRLYPVRGKVVWENGAEARELDGGLVVCEAVAGGAGVRGDIQKDGSFQLSTYKEGDGVLPGKYRVAVVEYSPREPPPPPIMDRTFAKVETSRLEIDIERKTNEVILTVRRAPPRQRK
jgi:hypothetical protein